MCAELACLSRLYFQIRRKSESLPIGENQKKDYIFGYMYNDF